MQSHNFPNSYIFCIKTECELNVIFQKLEKVNSFKLVHVLYFYDNQTKKIFLFQEYSDCGAVIQENMSEATLIMGVKGVPIDSLMRDKTYAFFSHTIKAQPDNMPLLDAILEKVKIFCLPYHINKWQHFLIIQFW